MRFAFPSATARIACLLFLATPGCQLFNTAVNVPGNLAADLSGNRKKSAEKIPPATLQTGVMRFADTFASSVTQASREFAERAGTPEARIQALSWTVGQSTSAYTIATGPNPNLALLDMLVLVSLGRMVHEEYWLPKVWGEADRPMLVAFEQLEAKAWEAAGEVLTVEQQEGVRTALRDWREQHPEMGLTAFVKLPVFSDLVGVRSDNAPQKQHNLSDLLSIDPLSGLEPAVRELERTRLLAERTVFYLQRTPILLQNQVELLGLKLMQLPEMKSVLADSERISGAAASLAETAAKLPEAVQKEREAALQQISSELTLQRKGIVSDLEAAEEPARKVLAEARATLEAGTQTSAALQAAISTLNGFLARFDKQPAAPGGVAEPVSSEQPGKPFDVSEYGVAAEHLGAAAREINTLLQTLDGELPRVQRAVDEATASGKQAIDHAFWRGLELGLALIAAAALAVLGVRALSARRARGPGGRAA